MKSLPPRLLTVLAGLLILLQTQLVADSLTVIDFEALADSTPVTNQFPGLTFANATMLSAGISVNEFEFPPHSGTNVVFDDGGAMSVSFASPIVSFGGYFTYAEPLSLAAFSASKNQVATATSAFSSNDALFGDPGSSPNEFLHLSSASGISGVTITGDPAGSSFVLDDATYTTAVPEPTSILLLLSGATGLFPLRKRLP